MKYAGVRYHINVCYILWISYHTQYHYLNQWWLIVNWNTRNNIQWPFWSDRDELTHWGRCFIILFFYHRQVLRLVTPWFQVTILIQKYSMVSINALELFLACVLLRVCWSNILINHKSVYFNTVCDVIWQMRSSKLVQVMVCCLLSARPLPKPLLSTGSSVTNIWTPSQYKDRLIYVWRFPC